MLIHVLVNQCSKKGLYLKSLMSFLKDLQLYLYMSRLVQIFLLLIFLLHF